DLAVERIKAARKAIDDLSEPPAVAGGPNASVVLTARCEAYLVGTPDPFDTSIERLVAFAHAGADCLYAPGVSDPEEISAIVDAVAPKPVNVLISSNNCNLTVAQLADLGVRRISVGGALARAAWGGFIAAATEIQARGSFASFADATPFGELNDLFAKRAKANSA
ncbi:MAG TPA: isocitrate lyase/phosphoenolpyruvate mutase family protein, partial [Pyrinomonadaceae bacterium]|nr:isocitrate lyase/phosphoenolpyruvate mutase family protein [Pyrinomonadaceae bacterium]